MASKEGRGCRAANGTPIKNYGEKLIDGIAEASDPVQVAMQVVDAKTLGSAFRMHQCGIKIVLDGPRSQDTKTGKMTKVNVELHVHGRPGRGNADPDDSGPRVGHDVRERGAGQVDNFALKRVAKILTTLGYKHVVFRTDGEVHPGLAGCSGRDCGHRGGSGEVASRRPYGQRVC